MKKQQSGFTLIELMIVVAIIGILASIALPQYQNFIARSQASESVVLLGGAKVSAEESIVQDGVFPADLDALTALDINTNGKYGTITGVTGVTDDAGTITYVFNSAGTNKELQSGVVGLTRTTGTGGWQCTATMAKKFAPKGCTGGATVAAGS